MRKEERGYIDEKLKPIEACIRTLNKEMGEVQGELKWIRWLLTAVLGVIIAGYFILPSL